MLSTLIIGGLPFDIDDDLIKIKASMKLRSVYLILFVVLSNAVPSFAKRCTGSAYCTACTNCSRCAHCGAGGSCGVCSGRSSDEERYNSPPKSPKRNTRNDNDVYVEENQMQIREMEQTSGIDNDYSASQRSTRTTEPQKNRRLFGIW